MGPWFARRDRLPDPERYPAGPVRNLAAAPPPPLGTPVSGVEFLAVDVETTGLDLRRDHVLAIGWLPVMARQVVLAGAREVLVRLPPGVDVGESATIHQLTDDVVAAAPTLVGVLPDLLAALQGRVLLAHHAPIELAFLKRAAQEAYDARLRSPRSTPWRCSTTSCSASTARSGPARCVSTTRVSTSGYRASTTAP